MTFEIYKGNNTKSEVKLPPVLGNGLPEQIGEGYVTSMELRDAVNVAIALGQPLLLTGEPGTGKSQLAYSLAYEFQFNGGVPLIFRTKSTSIAQDLFYQYDSIGHFRESQIEQKQDIRKRDFVRLESLGIATALCSEDNNIVDLLPEAFREVQRPMRAIILIDEIDKAPRDFPNDILNEIESMSFYIPELATTVAADPAYKPLVIITSNSEKNLPDAFLRRCVFKHIEFPSDPAFLSKIVSNRVASINDEEIRPAISHFIEIRKLLLKKKPGSAELIDWIKVLKSKNLLSKEIQAIRSEGEKDLLIMSYAAIAKSEEDHKTLVEWIQKKNG